MINNRLRLFLLIGTTIVLLIIQGLGLASNITTPFESAEYSARDLMMRLQGTKEISGDIVIVAIDDFSFNWTGYRWPWPRSYLAETVDQINKGGGKVVGVDILLFAEDQEPGNDEAFAKALGESPYAVNLVQIFENPVEVGSSYTISRPVEVYLDALDGLGTTGLSPDEDAIVRSVQAYDNYNEKLFYNWSFEVASLYLGVDRPKNPSFSSMEFNGEKISLRDGQMLVNFSGPANTFKFYSIADVHDGVTLEETPDAFKDKIVLIGATTITLQDVYSTPFSARERMPGVEIVANAVETLITGKYLTEAPPWVGMLLTITAIFLAWLILLSKRPNITLSLMAAAMIGYLIVCFIVFANQRYILPIAIPETALFLGVILPTLEQAVSQEREKRRVRDLFSRFISPEMVDQMMSTQDINSLNKRANISIIFSDIRGFTTLSEKLAPEDVVALLNPYLEVMSKVIYKHGGTIDKYEGDAIIAFFGEPVPYEDHAARALRASLDMRVALAELKENWAKEGRPSNIEMGIGVNSGEVFVGLLGSAQRINYTIIGDNANLAARLQDLTKTYDWPILISEGTYQNIKDQFDVEFADAVKVKGKTQAVNVYKLQGEKGAPESARVKNWQLK